MGDFFSIRDILKKMIEEKDYEGVTKKVEEWFKSRGLVELPEGSYWKWMYKDWFEKAIKEKYLTKNKDGQYVPLIYETTIEKPIGKRGKDIVYEKNTKLDSARFFKFAQEYGAYEYMREREQEAEDQFIQWEEKKKVLENQIAHLRVQYSQAEDQAVKEKIVVEGTKLKNELLSLEGEKPRITEEELTHVAVRTGEGVYDDVDFENPS